MQNYLPTDYQNFIALSRYARWKDEEQRRENWGETVDRYFRFFKEHLDENYNYELKDTNIEELRNEGKEGFFAGLGFSLIASRGNSDRDF